MMLRGGLLAGLASRVAGTKSFSTEIFVSRLSFYTTEEELKNVFSPFGAVEEARLVRDIHTGRPKGFAFVKYSSQADAEEAVKAMDGRVFALLIPYLGYDLQFTLLMLVLVLLYLRRVLKICI